ncbi:hypothetical protein OAU50_06760 [Planctomycetota bacterium]|nr:hypothetical protein [Planctomycetota bacterium]
MNRLHFSKCLSMNAAILAVLAIFCAVPLHAQDIGLGDKDAAWMLLQDPIGVDGGGLNIHAGDPGLPVLNPLDWPGGNWPTTELWHFDAKTAKFKQATKFLGGYETEPAKTNWRRTLLSVVRINDTPHVLHYDPYKISGHTSSLLKVNEVVIAAEGKVPADSIAFQSDEFFDAPEVSLDGKRIVMRFWVVVDGKYQSEIRMYSLPDFKLIATSEKSTHSRPVWTRDNSVATITWPLGSIPHQRALNVSKLKKGLRLHDNDATAEGKLIQLTLVEDKLTTEVVREGTFHGDKTGRTLAFDGTRLAWVEDDAGAPKVWVKDMKAGKVSVIVNTLKNIQGLSAMPGVITATGAGIGNNKGLLSVVKSFLNDPPSPAANLTVLFLRGGDLTTHASLLDFGNGIQAFAEPISNHEFTQTGYKTQPIVRHTLRIPELDFDSLRNPRLLVQMSGLMRSFSQFDDGKKELPSTQLVFDVDLGKKKGRMIEVYHAASRKGKGAIRVEDNLSGPDNEIFRSIYDDRGLDYYYTGPNANGKVTKTLAAKAGKAYDELESQLIARKMLTLTNVTNSLETGGLEFFGRTTHIDPDVGVAMNVATYMKRGRELPGGIFEKVWLTFVTALPTKSAGDWAYPHALCKAKMHFAIAGSRGLAVTNLMFDPDKFVSLERLSLRNGETAEDFPKLLLPGDFRIYNPGPGGKPVLAVTAKLLTERVAWKKFSKTGEVQSGYFVPGMARNYLRSAVESRFIEVER